MPRLSKALVCAFVLGFMAGPAVAQEQSDLQKAKEHYARAEQAMKSGDHALAASQYGTAYEITRDPVLFYKIASAHYEARNCEAAVVYYNRYLDEGKPDERFRALTQERIEACKTTGRQGQNDAGTGGKDGGQAAAAASSAADTSSGEADSQPGGAGQPDPSVDTPGMPGSGGARTPSFADQEVSGHSKAAWFSVGLAATFVTAGAVLGLSASSREEDLRNLIEFRYPNGEPAIYAGNSRDRYEEYIDEGERLARYSKIAFAAAGLATASAVAFFILDARAGKDQDAGELGTGIRPMATPDGLGMAASWRF